MSASGTHLTTIDLSFVAEPIASPSGRFALARPAGSPALDQPSPDGLRPWGLRRMGPAALPVGRLAQWRYDPIQQVSLGPDGTPLATGVSAAGPPTAPTTSTVDGEDPPSSEDWINDYCQDDQP
ncbi:MAG: putative ATP-grasp-modified RiPP [Pseudonocardiales bacterium]|nr:putative ATP-grasp-modified RiPP [Pseudonocardiales bacterium]